MAVELLLVPKNLEQTKMMEGGQWGQKAENTVSVFQS